MDPRLTSPVQPLPPSFAADLATPQPPREITIRTSDAYDVDGWVPIEVDRPTIIAPARNDSIPSDCDALNCFYSPRRPFVPSSGSAFDTWGIPAPRGVFYFPTPGKWWVLVVSNVNGTLTSFDWRMLRFDATFAGTGSHLWASLQNGGEWGSRGYNSPGQVALNAAGRVFSVADVVTATYVRMDVLQSDGLFRWATSPTGTRRFVVPAGGVLEIQPWQFPGLNSLYCAPSGAQVILRYQVLLR